jgi:hypothetical protein
MKDWLGRDVSGGKGNDFSGANFDAQPTIDYMRGKGIEDFKAQMRKGFARPNLFRVDISSVSTDKAAKYRMSCFQAQIPGVSLSTTDKDIGFRSVAYQKLFSDMTLGFYVSSGLEEVQFWQSWIDSIVSSSTNHFNLPKNYYGTIDVTQISRTGGPTGVWTLHDAYPKAMDPIALDYGTNDAIMTMATTITYRHYTHRYLDEQTATAIAADVTTKSKSDFRNMTAELRDEIEPSMGNAGGASLTKAGADSKYAGGGDMGPSEF